MFLNDPFLGKLLVVLMICYLATLLFDISNVFLFYIGIHFTGK